MQDLKLTIVQTSLHWENPTANLAMLEEKISHNRPDTDLILLPEMFTTGFTMNAASLAEPDNSTTLKWLKMLARQTQATVAGSYIVNEKMHYYNRLVAVYPNGEVMKYNKRHLFRMAGEHNTYSAGTERLIFKINGWSVAAFICYDLRFPVWSRNINNEYDLAIYVANWPEARSSAWNTLLPARAIENLCYVAGVNRTGEDGNHITYSGQSAVYDYKGEPMVKFNNEERVETIVLKKDELLAYRQKFPAHLDADTFRIE
ncbi:MAG: amidohydrolase [Cytophagaceae bacterium]|nr:amidohydrolase [Cytophagaceae bacterium]MDW8457130.1 amidohydrolase [Cytophagaceae bacterium]